MLPKIKTIKIIWSQLFTGQLMLAAAVVHTLLLSIAIFEILDNRAERQSVDGLMLGALSYLVLALLLIQVVVWRKNREQESSIKKLLEFTQKVRAGRRDIDFDLNRQDHLGELSRDMSVLLGVLQSKESELNLQYEHSWVALNSIADGVITSDSEGRVDYLNPVAETLTGWSLEEAIGQTIEKVFPTFNICSGLHDSNSLDQVQQDSDVAGFGTHTLLTHRDGSQIPIVDSAAPLYGENNEVLGVVQVFHDATNDRILHDKIEHQASHDALTGIWNRYAFEQKLENLQIDSSKNRSSHALLYIDLDQFKVVNDTAGHEAGDELLRQITPQLKQFIRGKNMLARIGGDEYGVLLPDCDAAHALNMAEKLRLSVEDFSFIWGNQQFKLGTSIGIAMMTEFTAHKDIFSHADLACYNAKEMGRNQVYLYSMNDDELSQRHGEMYWVSRIHNALEEQHFVLYSQKILPIDDKLDQQEHREILLRMEDKDGSIITPDAFIPAAERYGLMTQIDQFVVDKACDWLADQEPGSCQLSVNLSGRSMSNSGLLSFIEQRLAASPGIAKNLCFEITETAAISNLRDATQFMEQLIKLGVKFSLDDFGSGLSSFTYLKNLPVDYLKIDGSFVRDMCSDEVDAAMVKAITDVSDKLKIHTIAEFVENQETLDMLKSYGVQYAQGYGIEKPAPLM